MKFVVLFEDQPGTGMELRMKHMPSHLAFLEKNGAAISAAGPLKNEDSTLAGGLWLVEAETQAEVQSLVEEDPFWATGMRKTVNIHSWQQVFAAGKRLIEI